MSFKTIGIIPARYASTRFPGKPLVSIIGKTLIQRTYENACRASHLDHVVVATDDERIFNHVKDFGGQAIMTTEACPTGTDRLAEALMQHPKWLEASVIVNIQGDEPCVDPKAIDLVAQILIENSTAHMSTLVTPLKSEDEAFNPSNVKCVMDQNQYALYFSRTLIPFNRKIAFNPQYPYYRHIGLYAYRPSFLLTYQALPATPLQLMEDLEQLKAVEHGYRIKVAIVDYVSVDVNHPEDINKVEQWICKQSTFL
jgi:3-deoxy-manno-octulosonate cytidylyltransferase (CMP-KDO synthetase)